MPESKIKELVSEKVNKNGYFLLKIDKFDTIDKEVNYLPKANQMPITNSLLISNLSFTPIRPIAFS